MNQKEKAALLPQLVRSLQSNGASARNNALVALQHYPGQMDIVVPLITNALQDPESGIRMMAVRALDKIDPQNPANSQSVSLLVGCMTAPEGRFRSAAAEAATILGELHRDPDVAVPALIRALESDDPYMRERSATALGRFGGQAKAAVPALTKALEDSDAHVRREAATALKSVNGGGTI